MMISKLLKPLLLVVLFGTVMYGQVLCQSATPQSDFRKETQRPHESESEKVKEMSLEELRAYKQARHPKRILETESESPPSVSPGKGFKRVSKPVYHSLEDIERRYDRANQEYQKLVLFSEGSEEELAEIAKMSSLLKRLEVLIYELEECK